MQHCPPSLQRGLEVEVTHLYTGLRAAQLPAVAQPAVTAADTASLSATCRSLLVVRFLCECLPTAAASAGFAMSASQKVSLQWGRRPVGFGWCLDQTLCQGMHRLLG